MQVHLLRWSCETGTTNSSGQGLPYDAFALVLAGGNGTRLGGLTRWQCKPAVAFAGHFRNIDFTLSNCVNSGVRRIAVLTQYKSQTLINHLASGWSFLARPLGEFVEIWPAQQRLHTSWYLGTADAVHQNLDLIRAQRSRYTLVLAGDHIYKMDYRRLLQTHAATGADVTVGCVPVPISEAHSFGVLSVDSSGRVRSFIEKPPPGSLGSEQDWVLASMGIYVFNTAYLADRLCADATDSQSVHDFGCNIIPDSVQADHVAAHAFVDADGRPGYWRDVGTLQAYWQAHMELLSPDMPIDLCDSSWPIVTSPQQLPPARLLSDLSRQACVTNSLLAAGVTVRGAVVTNSVLSSQTAVGPGSTLDEAVVLPGARIGADCHLQRVIVDEGVEIPDGSVIGNPERVTLLTRDSLIASPEAEDLRSVA